MFSRQGASRTRTTTRSDRRLVVAIVAVWALAVCVRAGAAQQVPPRPATPPPATTPTASPTPGAERSTLVGVYTDQQADRGSDAFGTFCTGCHTTASHKGLPFKKLWDGALVWDLFDSISENMPKDDPGSLTRDQTTDLVAYFLKLNGMPAGSADLPQDEAALRKIRIEMPKSHD